MRKPVMGNIPFRTVAGMLAVLVILVVGGRATAEVVDRIVAVVNEDIITLSELNDAFAPYRQRIRAMNYPLDKERKLLYEAREQVLNRLINDTLTDQQIEKAGVRVEEKEIDAAIERVKKASFASDEDLRAALEREGTSYETYRERIKEQILRGKLVNREVKSKIVVTHQDIVEYYQAHKDRYAGEKKVHLRNIIKPLPPNAGEARKTAARQQMEDIWQRLDNGASFEQMAETYSESPVATEGGNLGVFSFSSLSPTIQSAVEKLKPGQFTPVLETDQGLQIFYVEDIIETPGKTVEAAAAEIQETLYQQSVDQKFAQWIEQLRTESHINIIR